MKNLLYKIHNKLLQNKIDWGEKLKNNSSDRVEKKIHKYLDKKYTPKGVREFYANHLEAVNDFKSKLQKEYISLIDEKIKKLESFKLVL